ncbi:MAG: helicase-related protein [Coleofasciculus chthonoplastes F2-STO-03]
MKAIPLPPVLPGDLNLSQINQQLRDRTAQLDWSAVVSAPEKQLTVLLAGLDLSDHADEVGINGAIADNIIAEISRFFKKQETKTKKKRSPSQPAPQTTPEVWTPVPSPVPPIQVPPILGERALGSEGIRAEFETAILNDLLGPVNGETEEIEESSVSDRYLIGLLAPLHRNKTPEEKPEQQDELTVADKGNSEEGTTEATIPPSETMFPSSFGMTFCVSGAAEQLQITAKWGTYKKEKSQLSFKEDGTPKQIWKRYPMQGVRIQNLIERLLTLQQFQRATALICACEAIRRNDEQTWGTEPIRIGLWVGQNSTPNYTSQSEEFTKQSRGQYQNHSGGSPHQLTNCPWCGSKIEPGKHIHVEPVEKGRGRTLIRCGDPLGRCPFSKGEGLPVLVVDEEIYRRLPALLIATVDKFAQMPWKGEVQMLFGQVNGYCQRHGFRSPDVEDKNRHNRTGNLPAAKTLPHPLLRPPDLIIQDELHLISGPLGTLVGLYETAIDQLSSWNVDGKRVRAKVVASTATIRQAQAQVHNLFLRKLHVFPPPGLDVEDNFFSKQRQPSPKTPGRRYLGICAPGRRLKAAIIRVYVASLAASQALYENYGEHADPWMTLVGYFNSLRELGGTRRLVEDDITSRLAKMDRRGLAKRLNITIDELTSRKDSTDIPVILDRLETPFNPQQQAETKARRKAGQKVEKLDPLDVILATNMISVGVDVKRLGVMVACGQPKNTAEYIQATSRVGRTHPGLVITVYNWARPRDLSHYERFAHYHATFYQNVEALSVTPFASGALYRGLTALFVSLVRQSGQDFNKNDSAGRIERDHPYIQAAIDAIVQRASLIEDVKIGEYVRQELETRLDKWKHKAENLLGGGILKYQADKRDGTTIELLDAAGSKEWQDFTCLNSLRNVEPTVGLILTDQPPDEDFSRLPQPMGMEMPEES